MMICHKCHWIVAESVSFSILISAFWRKRLREFVRLLAPVAGHASVRIPRTFRHLRSLSYPVEGRQVGGARAQTSPRL